MFIILTGSSGVGKNTIISELEKETEKYKLMPTITTRNKRPGEVQGYPYFFLTKDEFQQKIRENALIEYEFIHENFYGSSYEVLEESLKDGKILLKDIGIEGAQNLSIKIASKTPLIKVFLTTTKRELKRRLIGRGEKQIKLRLKRYKREQGEINKFDYIIYNNDLQQTCDYIKKLHEIKLEDILPTISAEKLCTKKINHYVSEIQKGKILKPVKVQFENEKLYIVKGHEKFIAGVLTNKPVAKLIVDNKKINKVDDSEIQKWKELLNQSK